MNSEAVFEQLKKLKKLCLNWLAGWLADWPARWLNCCIAQKQKLSRRRGYSAKSGLAARYFEYRGAFKAKVRREDEAARRREIKQQEAVRESIGNITRIGPTSPFGVVEKE